MGRQSKSNGPETYDFRRPTKLSREHTRTLQLAYEAFAKRCTTVLTSTLRVVSQVTLVSIEQATYDEYIDSLERTTFMALVELEPLPGVTVFEFSLTSAMTCIDHMLGGSGGAQPERPLTEIETPLMERLLDRVLAELQHAFESVADFRPRLTTVEYNPQFAQAAAASDPMIVASFEMRVGADECVATICMPFGSIFAKLQGEPGDATLSPAQRHARDEAQRNMAAGLHGTPIEVSVRFRPAQMRPSELIALRPGDVVPLGHPVSMPLAVTVRDVTFAYAVPGNQGARLACLVVPPPPKEAQP